MLLNSTKFVLFRLGGLLQLRQHKDEIRNVLSAEASKYDRPYSGLRGIARLQLSINIDIVRKA